MKKFISLWCIFLISTLVLLGCNSSRTNSNFNNASANSQYSNEGKNQTIDQKEEEPKEESNDNQTSEEKHDNKNELNANKQNITIVIDPGHSSSISNETELESPDSKEKKLKDTLGATGVQSNIPEYTITHGVATELEKILKSDGYNVIMTKKSPDVQLSNIERTTIANDNNANLIIRIHCDGVDSPDASGASILVPAVKGNITPDISKKSYSYGEKIINEYTEYTGLRNRGVVTRSDLTGFNWSKVPIVLIELGFISNPNEDSFLSNSENYTKIATGIANGINSCFQ